MYLLDLPKQKTGQKSEFEAELGESGLVCGKDVFTAKSISIVPFKKYTQFRLTKFMSGVHK